MPRANLEFVDAVGARPALETYVNILLESDVRAVGGALPGDEFYYTP
jgi:NitT/TauT family transport system substrate-binding protein